MTVQASASKHRNSSTCNNMRQDDQKQLQQLKIGDHQLVICMQGAVASHRLTAIVVVERAAVHSELSHV